MTAKEFLKQGYLIDERISIKLKQVHSLRELATNCSATLTGMPHSSNKGNSTMAKAVEKIVDLENEINADIDNLVETKQQIIGAINQIKKPEYRALLEMRYIDFKSWEQIATEMRYSVDNIFKMHRNALKCVVVPKQYSNLQ